MDDERIAHIARALAHPIRVGILRLLAQQPECRGAEVFAHMPLAQSTISEHLRVLKEAGLVTSHAVGNGMVYCVVNGTIEEFRWALDDLTSCTDCGAARDER